jgi:CPA1 family monovalent cation:H+ antiporter
MADTESGFLLIFVVASAVAIAARRLRLPYTVALVVAGLLLGSLHAFRPPELTKEILFAVVLPGLLFEAGFHLEFREFRRDASAILALAVPGVVAAIGLTALILAAVARTIELETDFTWSYALVFGAVVAATDPIAVMGLFRSARAPSRLSVLLEGESLFNDGTAIVLFTLVLAAVTGGTLSASGLVRGFLTIVGGGALVGGVLGLVISEVVRRVDDPMIEITLTTIAAYGAFLGAEQLQFSGVIATVAAGMLCGNYGARTGMSPSTRVAAETFWEYVAFALNSIVFLLIGFRVQVGDLLHSWLAIVAAYVAVTVGRAVVVVGVSGLLRAARQGIPPSWVAVLTWGGLRGGLSMVLALSLPAGLPHRHFLVTTTFGVVILSILVQGLTMSPLLRRLGIVSRDEARSRYERIRAQVQAANAALAELEEMSRRRHAPRSVIQTLEEEYQTRVRQAEAEGRELQGELEHLRADELKSARRHLLLVEKDHLLSASHRGELAPDIADALLADVDARLVRLEANDSDASA